MIYSLLTIDYSHKHRLKSQFCSLLKPTTTIIIGGGAAGFFCAVNLARLQPQMKVIILEKSSKLLSKVKISGGGRCNVTHACFDINDMSNRYPRGRNFVKKIFHQFFTTDTIAWFKERGVAIKAEKDGRMFPVTDSSQTIIDCLLKEANKYQVDIRMNVEVTGMEQQQQQIVCTTRNGEKLVADHVCVAAGGYPKSTMFDWLIQTGHTIANPVPSLFTFNIPGHSITSLMGVSVPDARVKIAGTKLEQQGPVLITHWGLSGPAVLKLSAWGARELQEKNWHYEVLINWLPQYKEPELRELLLQVKEEQKQQKITGRNPFELPNRLWEFFVTEAGINKEVKWADVPVKLLNRLIVILNNYSLPVKGKTTYKEEFVTAGGIQLQDIDANTMMSKLVPNLFFAGEITDVDGITGGYNFQYAWTTGWVAANHIARLFNG